MSDHKDALEFLKGVALGGAIGAVAALLLAPKTGRELRDELRNRIMDLLEEGDSELSEAQRKAEELLEEATRKLEELKKIAGSQTAYTDDDSDDDSGASKNSKPARKKAPAKSTKPGKSAKKAAGRSSGN